MAEDLSKNLKSSVKQEHVCGLKIWPSQQEFFNSFQPYHIADWDIWGCLLPNISMEYTNTTKYQVKSLVELRVPSEGHSNTLFKWRKGSCQTNMSRFNYSASHNREMNTTCYLEGAILLWSSLEDFAEWHIFHVNGFHVW